ncbi:MAG TPA: exodeoxyribonuclease VII large subunit [Candidatus Limnocylindrales bacterium]
MRPDEGPPEAMLPPWDAVPDEPAGGAGSRGVPSAAPSAPDAAPAYRVRTVSEVARALRDRVRSDEAMRNLWVEGEVSRYTVSTAGHAYFTLKDARAQLQCVWFRDERLRSSFQPSPGLAVVAHGRMDVFESQGAVQLYVESMQPAGFGNLALRFEQTKARLAAEGLFDAARKRPLPVRPRVIALVTSPTGAVRHDVCNVLARRWPLTRVLLVPCLVQGPGAPGSIAAALRALEAYVRDEAAAGREADAPSLTILARGGGSPEDLWAFNEERVVRAVASHLLPVVAGIGHETDVTLTDFAADVRAPTPSAAAELVVPDRIEIAQSARALGNRADAAVARRAGAARRALDNEARVLLRVEPTAQLATSRERVGLLLDRATRVVARRLDTDRRTVAILAARPGRVVRGRLAASASSLAAVSASLAALDPDATLRRGYAIVRRSADGAILRVPADAPVGERLHISLAGGTLDATSEGPASGGSGRP